MSQETGTLVRSEYTVGTLTYTKMTLIGVFFWILWGDFCFTLMETVVPKLVPLTLKDIGASNLWIGLIMGTIPNIMNAVICPIVSFKSDRHRSKWGRRIPFLLWPTPFITLFLVMTGYAPAIGTWLHGWLATGMHLTGLSRASVILIVTGFCMIGFTFFNMFVGSVYYYLWADVVPEHFMGRFMACFRMVGGGAGLLWNYYILGMADKHMAGIFVGIGVIYFVAFMMMCLRVKEGEYPPPPPQPHGKGIIGGLMTYFHESFRVPYYVWFFVGTTIMALAGCSRTFEIFLYRDTLHLTLDQIGKVSFWCVLAGMGLMIPIGYLSDRLHPLRVVILGTLGMLVTALLCFFFLHNQKTMIIFLMLSVLPSTFVGTASLPMFAALLPKERYGQFCSAQAIFNSVGQIVGSAAAGLFMDFVHDYRYVFVWQAVFIGASLFPMLIVYRGWQRHGGAKNYVAPGVDIPAG
jgi:maltose/moltooligosaccharide transporter